MGKRYPLKVVRTLKKIIYMYVSELGSCKKVEMAVLGSPSLIILMVSVDV